jgi:hypothetical protein
MTVDIHVVCSQVNDISCLCRFNPIQYRLGIRNVIAEKYVDIFNAYEADLIQVQQLYEEFKVRVKLFSYLFFKAFILQHQYNDGC